MPIAFNHYNATFASYIRYNLNTFIEMELITLASSALGLAMPYLVKTGEAIAEKVGEDIWGLVKSLFSSEEQNTVQSQLLANQNNDDIVQLLIDRLNQNPELRTQLEDFVIKGQETLSNNQTINNAGNVDRQINITQNSGNIQM